MFWKNLEYFRYLNYEPVISVWEDMKEKLCDEYLSPYFRAHERCLRQDCLDEIKEDSN